MIRVPPIRKLRELAPAYLLLGALAPIVSFILGAATASSLAEQAIDQQASAPSSSGSQSPAEAMTSTIASPDQSVAQTPADHQNDTAPPTTLHALTPTMDYSKPAATTEQPPDQPLSKEELIKKGVQLTVSHNWDDAEKVFQEALAKDPTSADAYYNLGAVSEDRGNLERALNYYQLGLKFNPTDPELAKAVSEVQKSLDESGARAPTQSIYQSNLPQNSMDASDLNLAGWKKLMKQEQHHRMRQRVVGTLVLALIVGGAIALTVH